MTLRRSRIAFCAAALTLATALSACGATRHPADATAENNGSYVKVGSVEYQLQVSRELNKFSIEDHQYLTGLPSGVQAASPQQVWYGVFLRAINDTKKAAPVSGDFVITDAQDNKFYPVQLDTTANQYAWTQQTLAALGTEPAPDTTAYFGPTQGALLLFKLPVAVYSNRPLTLEIHEPGSQQVGTISLDL